MKRQNGMRRKAVKADMIPCSAGKWSRAWRGVLSAVAKATRPSIAA
eukprot:CAMPEP_0175921812 /NCGR_PEP_ID=MMETSP0108-20121206/13695_1 /TAXON_ID=195067 ORGANISM="Goniomonas pacifica, Strain CCMP1869" /NCGR_SAMPLE_ID=MMETSP0108 /ASSEMBLY_ACC=CAM_ASM_000204 /LENGTH=45 /DNA_ID= /DNA_START= /DNA_END= /DNA_ORIENTATION=